MNALSRFFIFCSGANSLVLARVPSDVNKYAAIGATVFFTGIFAAIAGGFALFSVFKSIPIAIIFGLFWGLMIFNLDRYIVMSIKKSNRKSQEWKMALPRLLLATLIAFVIAKPLELKLFQTEIDSELVLIQQQRYLEQEQVLVARYTPQIDVVQGDLVRLNAEIQEKVDKRDQLNTFALQEADGTGGSGMRNLGPIYLAKKRDADLAQLELDQLSQNLAPIIEGKRTELATLEAKQKTALSNLDQVKLDGFAAQMDALGNLADKSGTIFWASIFITFLFIAIETSPLFVKLMSSRSPYDVKLAQHEYAMMAHSNQSAVVDQAKILSQQRSADAISKFQTLEAINAEKALIKSVLNNEIEKLQEKPLRWHQYREMGRKFT